MSLILVAGDEDAVSPVANDAAIIGELRRGLSDDAAYLSSAGQRQKQEHRND